MGVGLGLWSIWQKACLVCTQASGPPLASHKPEVEVHTCHPSTWREKEEFKASLGYKQSEAKVGGKIKPKSPRLAWAPSPHTGEMAQ